MWNKGSKVNGNSFRFLTLNMICSFLCQCWQWHRWFCFWNVVIFRMPQRSIITWLTQTVHCSAGDGRPLVIFIITNSNDRPWWYLYQRSYLVYHALTPNIEHELFLAPASEGMKINRPKYLHLTMAPCWSVGLWELRWWHCSTDTSGQCPHILVVWHCSWVTEAVYQLVNTAANLSQPTINTHAPG